MPQNSLSSTSQSIGSPGSLVFTCQDNTGAGGDVTIFFNPAYARMVQPEYFALQHRSVSLNGSVYVFQLSTNEPLVYPIEFQDIPYGDGTQDPRDLSHGMLDLLSFIRVTLNYAQSACNILTPDGFIETMTYVDGIDSFIEAGQNTRSQR